MPQLKHKLGAASIALAFAIYLTSPSLVTVWLPASWAFMLVGIWAVERRRPSNLVLAGIVAIVGSAWLAVPISLWANPGNLAPTIWLALLTSILVPLAWVKEPKPVFVFLIPVWLIQAVFSIHQWLSNTTPRVYGLAENVNAGAAFLLLGVLVLINGNSRAKWLILPLIAVLPFTGSRWVAMVAGVIIVFMFAKRVVPWRWIVPAIALSLAVVLIVGWEDSVAAFNRQNTLNIHLMGDNPVSTPHVEGLMHLAPIGFYNSGIHNVPIRMAKETGPLSALMWSLLSLAALFIKPRFNTEWWLALAIFLLSWMYYFTWIGPLGGFWWLLIGKRLQEATVPTWTALPSIFSPLRRWAHVRE